MQVENDYEREVYNGDLGVVRRIDLQEGELTAEFDGREVSYTFGELDELALAYATTIHESQARSSRRWSSRYHPSIRHAGEDPPLHRCDPGQAAGGAGGLAPGSGHRREERPLRRRYSFHRQRLQEACKSVWSVVDRLAYPSARRVCWTARPGGHSVRSGGGDPLAGERHRAGARGRPARDRAARRLGGDAVVRGRPEARRSTFGGRAFGRVAIARIVGCGDRI